MDMGLEGKRALVMGASKGLGFGIAKALAVEGARVAMVSRNLDSIKAAARTIGPSILAAACDTAHAEQIDALADWVERELGGVDILVLNSGGPPPGKAQHVPSEQWRTAFDSMFVHLVRLADHILPGMTERRFGRIISVISSGVLQPIPNLAISNAIRPALVGWGKTLASEVASQGITVNALAPGRVATDRIQQLDNANAQRTGRSVEEVADAARSAIPAGRYGTVEEFAAAAVFLASERSAFITGSILRVDGGQILSV